MSRLLDALNQVSSHPEFWKWVGIAIAAGLLSGALLIMTIVIRRRKQTVNSLIALEDCIGLSAIVEVPFDETSHGKVTIQLENRTLGCFAYSDQPHSFSSGDAVIIVGIKGNKVWVIPDQEFRRP